MKSSTSALVLIQDIFTTLQWHFELFQLRRSI
jgi:hypothetical protein